MPPRAPRRVFLVRPAWPSLTSRFENTYNRLWPPLSALYVATQLRSEGIEAEIVDLPALRDPQAVLLGIGGDDLVLLSTADVDRWQCPPVEMAPIERTAAALRSRGARLVLTGSHGTMAPEWMLERAGADILIRGEPESASVALARGEDPETIPGLLVRQEGDSVLDTGAPTAVDLTRLPAPDYGLLDLDRYRYELMGDRFALFEGSRGCPFPCAFCSRAVQGRSVRRKRPGQLIAEVERGVREAGVRTAYFIDLEFHLGGDTSRAFCEHMATQQLPLSWCCQLRPKEVDDALLDALAAGGCRLVHCGIESGSDERLKELDKVSQVEEMVRGVERILSRGMEVLCFFILGFPGESEADVESTVSLALQLQPTYASFHLFTPYPGTAFAMTPSQGPHFVPPTHPDALPLERLAKLRRSAYLRFYLRPGYVLSRLGRRELRALLRQARIFASQVTHKGT